MNYSLQCTYINLHIPERFRSDKNLKLHEMMLTVRI